jgi:predicted small lipoprotein YifL
MRKMIAFLLTVICVVMLAGCGKKAEPIDLPSNEAVISIEVITLDGAKADITEANQIETVMTALSAAEPTRLESVNDQPTNVDAYGTISINTVGESTVVYYYDKDSKHYIEQPYRGIYEMEDYLEETLLQE